MCATEYALGLHCGVTFAGIKPSSLIGLKKEETRELDFYINCFEKKGFRFEQLKDNGDRKLYLVYKQDKMNQILFDKNNKDFLVGQGYWYKTAEQALCRLKEKMAYEEFPHEIGIFLGYPLEDVKGFIESPSEGVMMTGYWKVYEDAEAKAKLFERFKKCSERICCKLREGKKLADIFGADSMTIN